MSTRPAADDLRARSGGPWTQEKLVYLSKYAQAFMTAMRPKRDAGRWEGLIYFDPLCGPRIDIDKRSGQEFPGSPLLALQTVPAFDRLYFGDKSRLNVAALRQRIAESDSPRVSLELGDCHQRARTVVDEVSSRTLGLAFLDPEGFEVHFKMFQMLAERR